MATPKIVWEEPRKNNNNLKWPAVLQLLKKRPGVWARVAEMKTEASARSGIYRLRRLYPEWEYTTRDNLIYCRYKE